MNTLSKTLVSLAAGAFVLSFVLLHREQSQKTSGEAAVQMPDQTGRQSGGRAPATAGKATKGSEGFPSDWKELLDRDPEAAMAKAAQVARTSQDRAALRSAASYLLSKSFKFAPLVSKYLTSLEYQQALQDVLPSVATMEVHELVAIADTVVGENKNHTFRLLGAQFIKSGDAEAAMAIQEAMPFGTGKEWLISGIFDILATTNTAKAFEWLPKLEKTRELPAAISRLQLAFLNASSEPDLTALLTFVKEPESREKVILSIASLMQRRGDFVSLESFKAGLSDREKDLLVGLNFPVDNAVGDAVAEFNKAKDPFVRRQKISSFVSKKAATDPERTATEVLALNDTDFPDALRGLTQTWVRLDSERMSVWVQKLPSGARRDSVIREFAVAMNRIDKTLTPQIISWHEREAERQVTRKMFPRQ
jgi:hypothetical protein